MRGKIKTRKMEVECGSLKWRGKAISTDEAIIKALKELPDAPSLLLRVYDGQLNYYINFKSACRIAWVWARDF